MTAPGHSLHEIRERAALYALGALPPDELQELETHLAAGCTACANEVRAFAAMAANLARLGPSRAPRSAVRDRVLLPVDRRRHPLRLAQPRRICQQIARNSNLRSVFHIPHAGEHGKHE